MSRCSAALYLHDEAAWSVGPSAGRHAGMCKPLLTDTSTSVAGFNETGSACATPLARQQAVCAPGAPSSAGSGGCVQSMYALSLSDPNVHTCSSSGGSSSSSGSTALAIANNLLAECHLPGNTGRYLPVQESSDVYYLGSSLGFSAADITLGSSYFQRLCSTAPALASAVKGHPEFSRYSSRSCDHTAGGFVDALSQNVTLLSLFFTCVFIASKVIGRPPNPSMLPHMLTWLYGSPITYAQAYQVEVRCLEGLGWRLGPNFVSQQLSDTWFA